MKKIFVLFASVVLFSAAVSAQEATVTYIKGKVEVQKNGGWVALNVGDSLSKSDVINTGFQSEAKIKLMDSVMYLGPVTRITLEELASSDSQDKVNVYLSTGSVRSKVNHTETKRVNYTVHTAVAVASVRGTDWSINSNNEVSCADGGVAVASIKSLQAVGEDSSEMEDSVELPEGGTVVQKNQTLTVEDTALPVAAPQNVALASANAILSSVGSASMKDSVKSGAADASSLSSVQTPVQEKTAQVVVKIVISAE